MSTPRIDRLDRNFIINGAFDFWQRANTFSYGGTGSVRSYFGADRWATSVNTTNTRSGTTSRSTAVPGVAASGFQSQYSIQHTQASSFVLAAGDWFIPVQYVVEGLDYARLHGGKPIALNFWFRSTLAGTYPMSFQNGVGNRTYVTTFSYTTANAWQYITIAITSDSSGSWNFDNTAGLYINFLPATGSNIQTTTLNSWQNASTFGTSVGVQMVSQAVTYNIAQVSLTESTGIDSSTFQRAGRSIVNELQLCQRYYEKSYDVDVNPGTVTDTGILNFQVGTTVSIVPLFFKQTKRLSPTVNFWSRSGASGVWRNYTAGTDVAVSGQVGGTGSYGVATTSFPSAANIGGHWAADAEL